VSSLTYCAIGNKNLLNEVLLIRKIRELLYEQGFTISGARNRLSEGRELPQDPDAAVRLTAAELHALRTELRSIQELLTQAASSATQTGQLSLR
jgi:DNA-binding transcriptional MerR regulator